MVQTGTIVVNVVIQLSILIVVAAIAIYFLDKRKKEKEGKKLVGRKKEIKKHFDYFVSQGHKIDHIKKWLKDYQYEHDLVEDTIDVLVNDEIKKTIEIVKELKHLSPEDKYKYLIEEKGLSKEVVGYSIYYVHFKDKK
ncbi:hypothetical protein HN419_00065 [Candidatus Woesearchaeota archaeon]|jgi:hypothetical protein|nr:hypothetical protein [Candidatus Woesearchaeota archaeon]MBT3538459.1 hypothetical protein [Candidatus Woesearchaeota archaeon]MBT4697022.1 hypothetical protein [Candidatus Woesearchaeota archaeon]MBT7106085.1 hypothetical protein [Candidatus Woesearchaeota archaeon]MBT7931017.1 hypothetical protein [Candidatus Woesearchaeota archaeon]